MRDRPPAPMTISVEGAARRIARLIDRPRRRLALPRRVVWPFRLVGGFFAVVPGLADAAVAAMIRRVEREEARRPPALARSGPIRTDPGRPGDGRAPGGRGAPIPGPTSARMYPGT
jgi:hypothetical protein